MLTKQESDIFALILITILLQIQSPHKLSMYSTPNSQRIKMESNCQDEDNEYYKSQSQSAEERVENKISYKTQKINNYLSLSSQKKVIPMSGCSWQEKLKNIELIQYLVLEVSRLQESNEKLNQYRRKSDQFLMDREELLQKLSKDQRSIELQKSNLIVKKQNLQRSYKQMSEKFTIQRDQLQKQLRKIQARQKAYQAQFRKKDNQIKHLQDSIKKIQDKSQPKNLNFQIIQRPSNLKSKQKQISAFNQYHQHSIHKVEEALKQLVEQNKYFKEFFVRFVEQLNKIFVNAQLKLNQVTLSQEQTDMGNLQIIKPEVFNLPMKQNRQKVEQLLQNVRILNKILILSRTIGKQDKPEGELQIGKWKIKSLIENYNELISCQDQIINKMISKDEDMSKCPREYLFQEQERCDRALQNFDFDKIRDMIAQQINQVESKNREIGETKNKLLEDFRRTEEIKDQMQNERSYFFELPF